MKDSVIKSLYNKQIKPNLATTDWTYKNQLILIKGDEKDSLLRGICFNSSAFSGDQFEIRVFVQPLYVPSDFIILTFGEVLKNNNIQWWHFDENNKENIGKDIASKINLAYDQFLSNISDATSFYNWYKKDRTKSVNHFAAVAYSSCYANLPNCLEILLECLSFISKSEDFKKKWCIDLYRQSNELVQYLQKNGNAKEIMENWVSATRKALKV